MTNQEVFDLVAEHMLKQSRKCQNAQGEYCYYFVWQNDGSEPFRPIQIALYDPIGILLAPAAELLNEIAADQTCKAKCLRLALASKKIDWELAYDLQRIHDLVEPPHWRLQFNLLAAKWNLKDFDPHAKLENLFPDS